MSLCVYCRVPLPADYRGDRECCRRRPRAPDQDTMCVAERRLLGTEPVEKNDNFSKQRSNYELVRRFP